MVNIEDTHVPLINSHEADSSSATTTTGSFEVVILPSTKMINTNSNVSKSQKIHPEYVKKQKITENISFADISRRLAMRKNLYNRLCFVTDIMCFLGILGIILMIIENEIQFSEVNYNDTMLTWSIKIVITLSTIVLIGFAVQYHHLDMCLYAINNGIEDSRVTLTRQRIYFIVLEILICAIHPIPRSFPPPLNASLKDQDSNSFTATSSLMYIDIDVALGIPMFLRLYLLGRFIIYVSPLFLDASYRSIGYLNKVSIDYFFLIKTYLQKDPIRYFILFCISILLIGSWCLRACSYLPTHEHISMLNSMWLFVITFTTVGYGDFTPTTYCGRAISAMTSLVGVFSTAVIIAVLAQKLLLNRWEKYVHNFVLNIQLSKEQKMHAANVVKFALKVWCMRHKNASGSSIQYIRAQRQLFQSIRSLHRVKQQQAKLVDRCIDHIDLLAIQRNTSVQTYESADQLKMMKVKVNNIEEKLIEMNTNMNNTINDIHKKLDMLLDKDSK
ncbi:unnamed protein product [Rotaria sp. Silwood2]|nr:unnamed protein product [Rotaria sp. Silwood2]